jgi:CNT family concentrative nucleoside transporter
MRHRWIVQTLFAWFFILYVPVLVLVPTQSYRIHSVIAFRFIPNSAVTRPVEAVWNPLVSKPWNALAYPIRLGIGFLCLLAVIFGSAFGFKPQNVSV